MSANTSGAVMASRYLDKDSLDFFPTPPRGARALAEHVVDLSGQTVWECAAGAGHMAGALAEYAAHVRATDVFPRPDPRSGLLTVQQFDFLSLGGLLAGPPVDRPDWIITNPPFNLLSQFLALALEFTRRGVCLLGRLQLAEGIDRYRTVYQPWAGHFTIAPFVDRLDMEEGCCAEDSCTSSAYVWLVVDKLEPRPSPLVHIPPCKRRLDRPGDFDPPEFVAEVRRLKDEWKKAKKAGAA